MNRKVLDVFMAAILIAGVVCTMEFGLPKAAETTGTVKPEPKTVVIDPGHGGIDPGKVGVNGSIEKDINLEISLKLKECLIAKGYEVVVTREDGGGLYSETDVNKKAADMNKRCEIIEKAGADIAVSIHQNSYTEPDVSGAQVFYYKHSAQGQKLAEILQEQLKDKLDKDNHRACKSNDNYYMLVHTPCPTVIVECGFLSCPSEEAKLADEAYQQMIAEALTAGIEEYFEAKN
ncbi:MAG: N-acetylmuramoyl-L-alanine amidase [Butyrivibrio sp.]|nr:N-acetylmuramoyl-L-alanine amidase [Butyrivibrio sp.]